jgi:hypothetical protein
MALKFSQKMNKDLKQAMLPGGAEFPGQGTSLALASSQESPT